MRIEVREHDASWPTQFVVAAALLRAVLGGRATTIHQSRRSTC